MKILKHISNVGVNRLGYTYCIIRLNFILIFFIILQTKIDLKNKIKKD